MSCTIEKVLSDARMLVNRLKEHDNNADSLIASTTTLHKRVDAMKQYQEDLNELNEVARHRPRSSLIMNLLQENTQIRELQQENKELRMSLEEHQSALELIMSKYREQIVKLVLANRLDKPAIKPDAQQPEHVQQKIDKICEMAAVMHQAIQIDDANAARDQQLMAQLKLENNTLREMLHIAVTNSNFGKNDSMHEETDDDMMESSFISVKEVVTSGQEEKDKECEKESEKDSESENNMKNSHDSSTSNDQTEKIENDKDKDDPKKTDESSN